MIKPLLAVQDLTIQFPNGDGENILAVKNLSFQLNKGESLGIVGESGSGKSMTALAIMQLLPKASQQQGQINWKEEKELIQLPEHQMRELRGRKIGMIFQEPLSSLNPVFTCGEQITEALLLHYQISKKEARVKAEEWFAKVQLTDPSRIFDAYPHQVSGGQRQRVMIAMALCANPELLICDEPTTALDVTVQHEILELLENLKAETGISIIFISHDLAVIKKITNQVLVLQNGLKVEKASVVDIFSKPQKAYTQGLLNCRPPLKKRLTRLPILSDFMEKKEEEISIFIKSLEEKAAEYSGRQEYLQKQEIILEVQNVDVHFVQNRNWYGKPTSFVKAVNEASFNLRKSECLGVVGESGSGKTTLGKAILRLVEVQNGSVCFQGKNLLELENEAMRKLRPKIQMVFQDPLNSLNPKMKIEEMLMEPLDVHFKELSKVEKHERVERIIKKVGLSLDSLRRYSHEFSGGQRQRIGIARALLMEPELLICDESVSALDVSVQATVLNLIKDLKEEFQFSLIFITHDLSVVKFIADTICVMKEGHIVERGDTESIFTDAQHSYTKKLLGSILK